MTKRLMQKHSGGTGEWWNNDAGGRIERLERDEEDKGERVGTSNMRGGDIIGDEDEGVEFL